LTSFNKKSTNKNSNSNESVENTKKSELDAIIKEVKIQIRRLFGGYKEQIERIGNVLKVEGLIKEEDICTEIKNALREEIKEKIISSDTIERCCPDEWKRKTKPKDSIDPQLRISEDKNPQEQETVTNTNTNITSEGQILQQEFEPDHSKIVEEKVKEKEKESFENDRQEQKQIIKEQEEELKRLRPLAEVAKEQECEEIQQLTTENEQQKEEIQSLREKLDKLKEEGGEEVWTAIGILELGGNQVPLKITVNTKQKKIEHVEIDREKIKQASRQS
jgi:hypothetical protein